MEVVTKINNDSVDVKLKDSDFKDFKLSDFNKLSKHGVVSEIAKTIQKEEEHNVLKTQFNNDVYKIKIFF